MKQWRVEFFLTEDHNEGEEVDILREEVVEVFATQQEAEMRFEELCQQHGVEGYEFT